MARYVYIGPEESRGSVPGHAFDEGVLAPYHIADLKARGLIVDEKVHAARALGLVEPEPVESEATVPATEERPQAVASTVRPRAPRQPARPAGRQASGPRRK